MSQQYERIMVAVDGSYESELAFIKGVHVAKRNNAHHFLMTLFSDFIIAIQ